MQTIIVKGEERQELLHKYSIDFPNNINKFYRADECSNRDEDDEDLELDKVCEYCKSMKAYLHLLTGYNFNDSNISTKGKMWIIKPNDNSRLIHGNVPPKEMQGYDRLYKFLNENSKLTEKEIADTLSNSVFTHVVTILDRGLIFYLMEQDKATYVATNAAGAKVRFNDLLSTADITSEIIETKKLATEFLKNITALNYKSFFTDIECGFITKEGKNRFVLFDFDGIH